MPHDAGNSIFANPALLRRADNHFAGGATQRAAEDFGRHSKMVGLPGNLPPTLWPHHRQAAICAVNPKHVSGEPELRRAFEFLLAD
ncbi:MAG TPA: hypothetical protein VFB55_08785 [Verrucomicrobiae bacterium]|nr:hypothetical protein [Verrucomicrobiae bacterium]